MASVAAAGLEVHEAGRALRVQTEAPHLVSMGSGRLSTAVTLHPLPEGKITLGSGRDADVSVAGTGVEAVHCAIENNNGVVTLHPINGNTFVDGVPINSPVRLAQGCMLSIGRSNYMRFNHPAEAKHLRSILPHSRISMAPISFSSLSDGHHLERKPPVAPRKSPRNSCSDDEIGFLGKLTKFEMLSKRANCVSPKVFPVGALTTNVPADQILGHSRSSSLVSLARSPANGCDVANDDPPKEGHRPDSRSNQIRMYSAETYLKTCQPCYLECGRNASPRVAARSDLMSRSLTCQGSKELEDERDYDMSQSLIVTKTTEFLYGSNPSISARDVKRIQPPSPAFNRNPRYNEQKRVHARVKSPTPSAGSGCSVEESRERQADAENKRREAETRRKRAQEERLREQEVERQEKMRLEEILAMCAEYERQSTIDKPRQPNRIITNGSLPRDKRLHSPFGSPKSPSKNQPHFSFDAWKQTGAASYENVPSPKLVFQNGDSPVGRKETRDVASPSDDQPTRCDFSTAGNYENVIVGGANNDGAKTRVDSTYGTIRVNGMQGASQVNLYENVAFPRNNDQNRSMPKKHGQLSSSCEMIENKLTISNDDLLEAIEQLSMLSKSKEICVTPKRNNSEKDNAKSNEAKADKERKQLEEEDRKKYVEFLRNEKLHILGNMDALKRSVAEIEAQEEEINREFEMEKALLSAEYESESLKLAQDEGEKIKVQMRINELEREMAEDNAAHSHLQAEAKQRVQRAQQVCVRLDEQLMTGCADEATRQDIADELAAQQDALESERKAFEDMEFHHLEEEASKLATREELQRYLSELTSKIETRKSQLGHLESQRSEAKSAAAKDARSLERQKLGHLKRLEEGRNRVREINEELECLAQNAEHFEEKRSPSREDFDRISRVTNDSPIVNNQGSLGRKTIESLKEIERNRQLHLAKQGSQVISEERRRVEELKRRVQDEVRSQWEERKMNCASFNSVESGEESSSYSTGPTESGSGSSDGAEGGNSEKLSPSKLSELTSPSPGPSNNSYSLLQNDNMRDDRRTSMEGERLSDNSGGGSGGGGVGGGGGGIIDGNGSRPLSQTSSEMDTLGPLQPIKHREKAKLQRPLTRYLPIKSESLDLRHHIETAGHQLPLIYDITIDTTSCSGYLSKMSKKFHHWNKRWFVFDRKRKTLSYYSDNASRKARGVIYFQSIEEVYVDHMNTVRSPQPSLTFIVKTSSRLYHLMAPSPEAMRVWVDVVFTGAEGYHEFDHGI